MSNLDTGRYMELIDHNPATYGELTAASGLRFIKCRLVTTPLAC